MPKQRFRTTSDVFAVVKPSSSGTYRCPIKDCPDGKKEFGDSRAFGRHLAFTHKIPSPKHNGTMHQQNKTKKGVELPTLLTKHCPNCGFDIERHEQAMFLLAHKSK